MHEGGGVQKINSHSPLRLIACKKEKKERKKKVQKGPLDPKIFRTMGGVAIDKRKDHLITRTHKPRVVQVTVTVPPTIQQYVPEKTFSWPEAESKVQELALAQGKEGHDTRTWIG